jgi:hypothetical protein
MPQTRWNKGKTIVNSDAYNLAGDQATQSDTLNVVIPVASQAERDALVPPQGVYAGMAVARTDLPGVPIQTRDGSGVWSTQQVPKVWANNVLNGSPANPLSGLQSGSYVPIIQGGTWVGTPDVNGYANLTFPQAFPNALITVGGWVGDNTITNAQRYIVTNGSAASNLTTFYFRCWDTGANSPATLTQRVNFFAIGI